MPCRRRLSVVTTFILGLLAGAAVMVPVAGKQVEQLKLEQVRLLQDLAQYQSRLQKLEAALQEPKDRLVNNVDLQLLWSDEAVRLDLIQKLTPIANELVGREVTSLNPYLLYAIFDDRIIDLKSRRFRLNVRAVVIAEETLIILAVKEELVPAAAGKTGVEQAGTITYTLWKC